MIIAHRKFPLGGVRYGPPNRPELLQEALAKAEARLHALVEGGATYQEPDQPFYHTDPGNHELRVREAQELIARITEAVAEESVPRAQVIPPKVWEALPKRTRVVMLRSRTVVEQPDPVTRGRRRLQEA